MRYGAGAVAGKMHALPPRRAQLATFDRSCRATRACNVLSAYVNLKMNGLRIYRSDETVATNDRDRVFYSRREGGPYYLWYYEDRIKDWRFARVHLKELASKALLVTNWKVIPIELQRSMAEHYQE